MFLLTVNIFFLFSCQETTNKKSVVNPIFATWRDNADTSHVIILTEKEWTDIYNGSVVSANPVTYSSERRMRTGKAMDVLNIITLEESKNNFYHFEILECDSFRLRLLYIDADREMNFVRE